VNLLAEVDLHEFKVGLIIKELVIDDEYFEYFHDFIQLLFFQVMNYIGN